MTVFEALILGIVQGASEFLPISSSGHLILLPKLAGWSDHSLSFDEALNTGTLLAVMVYFRSELLAILKASLRWPLPWRALSPEGKLGWMLAAATVPAGLAGLLLHNWVATGARNALLVATNLIVFGLLLFFADRFGRRNRDLEAVGWRDALLIGCAQALALVPGTSRSGVTMTMALLLGLSRPAAARFSFLLSVPIGLSVACHDGLRRLQGATSTDELLPTLVAFAASAMSGFLVIGWLLSWLRSQSMVVFTLYRLALGGLILALFL